MNDYETSPFIANKDAITVAVVGSGVTSVGKNAFAGLDKLKLVHLGSGVTSVGGSAFAGDTALTDVSFSSAMPTFGTDIFTGVTAKVYYPKNYSSWMDLDHNNGYGGTINWSGAEYGFVNMSDGLHYMRQNTGFTIDRWVKDNGSWYYFNRRGVMVTGWQELNCITYYFDANGDMVTGEQTIDGTAYTFDEYGRLTNPDVQQLPLSENYYGAKWTSDDGQYLYIVTVNFAGTAAGESLGFCPGTQVGGYVRYRYTRNESEATPDPDDGTVYTVTYDSTTYYFQGGSAAQVPYSHVDNLVVIHGGYVSENPIAFTVEDGCVVVAPDKAGDVLVSGDTLYPSDQVNPGYPPVLPEGELDPKWTGAPRWVWSDENTATAVFTYGGEEVPVEADIISMTETAATCVTAGKTEYTASVTFRHVTFTDTREVVKPALGHNPVKTEAKAPSCTEVGNSDYYTCSRCGKYFSDAACTNEITKDSWVIPATGHTWTFRGFTWTGNDSDGYTAVDAGYKCSVCNETGTVTADLSKESSTATCTTPGTVTYTASVSAEDSLDGVAHSEEKTVTGVSLGHELVKTEAKAATCTEAGNSDYYTCQRCGKYFSDAEGKSEIAKDSWVIEAKGHSWGEATYVWADDDSTVTAAVICINDATHKETETVATTSEVTKEATETETGVRVYTATFSNDHFTTQTKEEEIPCLPGPDAPERMWGATRTETAVAISQAAFPNGADSVVLASGDNYPDALAGGPLAYALDAPILLIRRSQPDQATLNEIKRLGAKTAYILGGTGVVSDGVANTLRSMGLNVERVAGSTRFDTAVEVAKRLETLCGKPNEVFFVYSHNYPDALAVSNVAALKGTPILYVDATGNLRDSTAAYIWTTWGA